MNNLSGIPRSLIVVLAGLAAVLLLLLAGGLITGIALMHGLFLPAGPKDVIPASSLLLAVIMLLIGCFVLLLMLLWCSCRPKQKDLPLDPLIALLPLLELLPDIKNALKLTAIALNRGGYALKQIRRNLGKLDSEADSAAEFLGNITTANLPSITIPKSLKDVFPNKDGSWNVEQTRDLDLLGTYLGRASGALATNLREIENVTVALGKAGALLGNLATIMGADSDPELDAATNWNEQQQYS
jgi:hypothetical protein